MFEIAMKEKYRAVVFSTPNDVLKALAVLVSPIASQHVRRLGLSPHVLSQTICRFQSQKVPGRHSRLLKVFRNRKREFQEVITQDQILRVFNGLSRLDSLELHSRGNSDCRELRISMPFIAPTFASFKELRNLILDIMLEGYQSLSPTIVFPMLERLDIVLSHAYCSTDHKSILDNVLAPFVNNHHATLRILHLSTLRSLYIFDIPSFLSNLRHYPQLETFGLWHPFVSIRQSDSAGVTHILRLHSEHLLELSLHAKGPIQYSMYPTADQWYAQEFLQVKLPKLQVLDLDIELYPDIVQTTSYLGQFRHSLLSLKLSVNMLSYEDVKEIAQTFSEQDGLLELQMSIDVLSPHLLSLLASELPSLEILVLEFDKLSSSTSDGGVWSDLLVYPALNGWKLRQLTAEPSNDAFGDLQEYRQQIRAALPCLKELKMGRNQSGSEC
ncbi:hypothetical protein E4T56_gene2104 [Termitomyces sp. T112]|nr:hypothetical protein E4T56_gene2104 [Termitomyces sp. T112]